MYLNIEQHKNLITRLPQIHWTSTMVTMIVTSRIWNNSMAFQEHKNYFPSSHLKSEEVIFANHNHKLITVTTSTVAFSSAQLSSDWSRLQKIQQHSLKERWRNTFPTEDLVIIYPTTNWRKTAINLLVEGLCCGEIASLCHRYFIDYKV